MSMDIYTKVGSKIVVTKKTINNGTDAEKLELRLYLKMNKRYTLLKIEVHDFHTDVWLKEFHTVRFNSVQFENA